MPSRPGRLHKFSAGQTHQVVLFIFSHCHQRLIGATVSLALSHTLTLEEHDFLETQTNCARKSVNNVLRGSFSEFRRIWAPFFPRFGEVLPGVMVGCPVALSVGRSGLLNPP